MSNLLPASPDRSRGDAPTRPLSSLLRQARAELHQQPPPPWPALAQRRPPSIAAETSPIAPVRRGRERWRWSGWAGGSAVAFAALAAGAAWLVAPLLGASGAGGIDEERTATPFTPVAPAERWLRLAETGAPPAWVVTAEMPRARLASLGLPFDPAQAGGSVHAELLMNPAGEVLAVRVVPVAHALASRSSR